MIISPYKPKSFCREYVEIRGSSGLLGMFMSTVLGIKPLMDDWVPTNLVPDFKQMCKSYGLHTREDAIFLNASKKSLPDYCIGKDNLTSTVSYGMPLESRVNGLVHIFISRNAKMLPKGMWYPIIVKNRVILQPLADTLKYGYTLGYPECCIRYFRKFNDWSKYSFLYEIYVRSRGRFSFLCNPFLKDSLFSYIYHMPCTYSCAETIRLAGRLRKEIKKREPEYVTLTDHYLQLPFFVLYEKKIYCFDGRLNNDEIRYSRFYTYEGMEEDEYSPYFKKADTLRLKGRYLTLLRRNKIQNRITIPFTKFAPEYPFLVQFTQ